MKKKISSAVAPHLTLNTLFVNIVLLLIYIVAGKWGLGFASVNPSATAIWAPTGIALAAILIFGFRVIPAIFFGAFIVNSITAGTFITSVGIAIGNTLEAIIGAYLVNKFANGKHAFDSVADIFKFTFFASILSTSVSANIGTVTLILGGLASWNTFLPVWMTWWLGNMGGSLVIAPLILVWVANPKIHINYQRIFHFLVCIFIIFIITKIISYGIVPYPYLYIPIAVWIAFWFGQKGATAATIIVAAVTIAYTLDGIGPFASSSINRSLIQLQLFLNIFSLTALVFAATVLTIRKSEKTLAAHEHRFQSLIEKSSDGVVLIDATSKIIYASPSNKHILGYTPEELQGTVGFDLVIPEDRSMTMRKLAELVLKPGGVVTVEYRLRRKDKKIIWVEATGTNLVLDPNVNAVVVNFHDITEKKVAQENLFEEKLQDDAMLASIGDGIIATNHEGKITLINQAACDTLGWKKRELIGKLLIKAIVMEDENGKKLADSDRPITKVLSLGKKIVTSQTEYYVKKDKTKLPVRFTITPLTLNNKLVGTIEVFHDITKEKELDHIKDDFISMTSHELRTPMTAINGLLSMILHGDYGPVNKELIKPLENINLSAQRQIHLINDLLNVSRLQTGRIEFKLSDFSIKQVVDETIKSLMPLAQQKGLTLALAKNQETLVQGDSEWTKQILNNLIGNAVKFTEKGMITLSYYPDHNNVLITIADTGIGIDSADQKKLFGKFQQLTAQTTTKHVGSGLGLYLSRELARKMGGDLWLGESKTDRGSIFILALPRSDSTLAKKTKTELANETRIAFEQKSG